MCPNLYDNLKQVSIVMGQYILELKGNHKRKNFLKKEVNKEELQKQLEKRLKMAISYITINNYLNVNGQNIPIKRYRVADKIKKKEELIICCPKRLTSEQKTQTKSEGMKKGISYRWD